MSTENRTLPRHLAPLNYKRMGAKSLQILAIIAFSYISTFTAYKLLVLSMDVITYQETGFYSNLITFIVLVVGCLTIGFLPFVIALRILPAKIRRVRTWVKRKSVSVSSSTTEHA